MKVEVERGCLIKLLHSNRREDREERKVRKVKKKVADQVDCQEEETRERKLDEEKRRSKRKTWRGM